MRMRRGFELASTTENARACAGVQAENSRNKCEKISRNQLNPVSDLSDLAVGRNIDKFMITK